jgi:WD40 repeat protein
MDFGLAKLADSVDLTQSGELIGTLRYMAPERFGGRFDARSDVYSLGLTLYEAMTLRSAYDESDRGRLITQILNVDPPPPRQLDGAIPSDLETIVLKAIARDPQGRYATAGELAADLGRFLSGRPIQARRVGVAERLWRWCRRNPGWAALTSLVVVLGLALLIISSLSAIWLRERAIRAEVAERKMEQQIWISKHDQARALRMSRRPGQRIESLRVIDEAMRMPIPSGHSLAELRIEAIAALALPDIEVERTWQGGVTKGIVALAVEPSLNHYARLSEDGTVTISRASNSDVVAEWREDAPGGWRAKVGKVGFSQDGRYLYVWHRALKRLVVRRWGSPQPTLCYERNDAWNSDTFGFTPDSTRLIYVDEVERIVIVDLATSRRHDLPLAGMQAMRIKCAPDGRRMAIAGRCAGTMTIEIRDLTTGLAVKSFPHPASTSIAMDWHPDGRLLATASDQAGVRGRISLWDVSRGEVIRTFEGHKTWGVRCAFDAAGERLLSNDWDKILRVWEPSSGRQLLSLPAEDHTCLQVSPDDRVIATSVADTTTLQLLHLHGSREFRTLAYELTAPTNVVFHPAGRLLAVGNRGPVLLIDLTTGLELGKLPTADGDRPLLWDSKGTLFTFGRSGLLKWPARADTTRPEHYRVGPPQQLLTPGPREQWGASKDVRNHRGSRF